jgi:hypothetical protein
MIDPIQTTVWAGAARAALELMRSASALLPKGREKKAIDLKLGGAEQALELSSAKLAQELGYPLCRCTFPPKPMLWDRSRNAFVCREPGCRGARDAAE